MKIERFKYLKEKRIPELAMFNIVKYKVVPAFDICFDELVLQTIKSVPVKKLLNLPVWELYLNVLICEYKISKNAVEEAVQRAVYELK